MVGVGRTEEQVVRCAVVVVPPVGVMICERVGVIVGVVVDRGMVMVFDGFTHGLLDILGQSRCQESGDFNGDLVGFDALVSSGGLFELGDVLFEYRHLFLEC